MNLRPTLAVVCALLSACGTCDLADAEVSPEIADSWLSEWLPRFFDEASVRHPGGVCVRRIGLETDDYQGEWNPGMSEVELSPSRLAGSPQLAREIWHHELCHAVDSQHVRVRPVDVPVVEVAPQWLEGAEGQGKDWNQKREHFAELCSRGPDAQRWLLSHLQDCPADLPAGWQTAMEFLGREVFAASPSFVEEGRTMRREGVWTLEDGMVATPGSVLLGDAPTQSCWSRVDGNPTVSDACDTLLKSPLTEGHADEHPHLAHDLPGEIAGPVPVPPRSSQVVMTRGGEGWWVAVEQQYTFWDSVWLYGWSDGETVVPWTGLCASARTGLVRVADTLFFTSTSEDGLRVEYWRP